MGGPSANVGSSANLGVLVFKASLLCYLGAPSAKEGSSAKYELTSKFTLASQRSFHITYERPIKWSYPKLLNCIEKIRNRNVQKLDIPEKFWKQDLQSSFLLLHLILNHIVIVL